MKRELRDDLSGTGHPTESRYAIETENAEGINSRHKDTGFGGNESTLPLKTVEEILSGAGEDASWIVEDILARGALTEFSGLAKKGGKTTFWCHAIATEDSETTCGEQWWGHSSGFDTRQHRVRLGERKQSWHRRSCASRTAAYRRRGAARQELRARGPER